MATEDKIIIIEPNGIRRSRPLSPQGITIGRGSDSDLSINYNNASRYHAQVISDGTSYYVVDLNSTNGTYLGNNRLTPNVPEIWRPGVTLRIAEVVFQLEQAQVQAPGGPGAQQADMMATTAGWQPSETASYQLSGQTKKKSSRWPIVLVVVLVALCFLAALGVGAYFAFM